jgi:hypothetical protein
MNACIHLEVERAERYLEVNVFTAKRALTSKYRELKTLNLPLGITRNKRWNILIYFTKTACLYEKAPSGAFWQNQFIQKNCDL